jgi:hypothetical protein
VAGSLWLAMGRQEWIGADRLAAGFQTVEIGVLLDVLLEDVHQLEVKGEGPGGGDRFGQIHLTDQLHDGIGVDAAVAFAGGIAELLQLQQPFSLPWRTFAAQHLLPEVFHQLHPFAEKPCGPRRRFRRSDHRGHR